MPSLWDRLLWGRQGRATPSPVSEPGGRDHHAEHAPTLSCVSSRADPRAPDPTDTRGSRARRGRRGDDDHNRGAGVIHHGDVRDVLPTLDAKSVQCVITSPPYWGLRDYGVTGQIGLEPTPDDYVQTMVEVFREVKRVLRDDGTLWLNLGDAFQDKQLLGQPWRVAFALQADGWYLRSDIIWAKGVSFCPSYSGSVMPESVTDRPTKSHEYLFLLTKSPRYYYDADAVRENWADDRNGAANGQNWDRPETQTASPRRPQLAPKTTGRNLRSVWTINPQPFSEAHFATFPTALVEPCIKAGTSEKGACDKCGAPWNRQTDISYSPGDGGPGFAARHTDHRDRGRPNLENKKKHVSTSGWAPSCKCETDSHARCVVLDPFAGSGTVGCVALKLGREFVGIELNPDYCTLARESIEGPLFARSGGADH